MGFKSDIVIGLEVHIELNTKTKLFCSCNRVGDDTPNARVCPICLGHPGTRPSLNEKALEYALKLGLALDSRISKSLVFSRKNYFYPDMPKNFQITQFENPIALGGKIMLKDGTEINITRIHIEEDPASITYPGTMRSSQYSLIDYNRAGNPLIELVTEPELTSPEQAREFMNQLVSIITYLGIYDINTCVIKSDVNVSIKETGYSRVEIKNVNGVKEIEKALRYEITRQKTFARRGLNISRETRGWNKAGKTTYLQRKKETEEEYGYIIEPDLPALTIKNSLIAYIKESLPELPYQKRKRFEKEYKLSEDDAYVMALDLRLANMFEELSRKISPKKVANWLRTEYLRVLNYNKKDIDDVEFGVNEILEILELMEEKVISKRIGQKLMERLVEGRFSPREHVKKTGMTQISSKEELTKVCEQVVAEQAKAVKDYINGEHKAFEYLVGQVMAKTRGKANPLITKEILIRIIKEQK